MELHLSQDPEADRLLSTNPMALLVGMVLDQQVPLEWAFSAPHQLHSRLGRPLDARALADTDPEALAALFSAKPALHRYPAAMAKRVHELATLVVEEYDGRPEAVWEGAASGQELFGRIRRLPGFGEQKAKIFVALLGKQLGVRPEGWAEVSAPFSDQQSLRSVADIVDEASLQKVRATKQQMKAEAKAKSATAPAKAKAKARPTR